MMSSVTTPQFTIPLERIHAFCQRWGIREFALFGSVLREDFRNDSDIDVMVQFRQGTRYSLLKLVEMSDELEAILGRKVDLLTRKSIEDSPNYIRRRAILDSAQVIYAE
jgi:predicted nucleotidyltransferase